MKKKILPIIGIILIASSLFGATRDIDITWHYFGTGTFFGIGLMLLIRSFTEKAKGHPKD